MNLCSTDCIVSTEARAVLLLIRVSQETAGMMDYPGGGPVPIQHLWPRGEWGDTGHWTPKITQSSCEQSLVIGGQGTLSASLRSGNKDPGHVLMTKISLLSRDSSMTIKLSSCGYYYDGRHPLCPLEKWSAVARLVTPPLVSPLVPGAGVSPPAPGPGSPSVAPVVESSPGWQHPESSQQITTVTRDTRGVTSR